MTRLPVMTILAVFGIFNQLSLAAECTLDNCADQKPIKFANAPGIFDFYVLALSWSSGFCQTSETAKDYNSPAFSQCRPGDGRGFVVHGLWPQFEHGYPSDCGPMGRSPSRIALEKTLDLYPDQALARHEWAKHGTCTGKSPTDYFADVRSAREMISIPPPFQNSHAAQTWTIVDIERAFIAANPRLRSGMLGVACSKNVLTEVRFCLSKDLRDFHACPEVSREGCHVRDVSVPPVL